MLIIRILRTLALLTVLIAVRCRLGRIADAETTLQELSSKYSDDPCVEDARKLIANAKRGVQPDMDWYFEDRFWAMWRY